MVILGINAYHGDASACLVKDGELVIAIEEERIVRVKHIAGFPGNAVIKCLEVAGVSIEDVDLIAVGKDPKTNLPQQLLKAAKRLKNPAGLLASLSKVTKRGDIKTEVASLFGVQAKSIKAEVVPVEHHIAHIASGYLFGPEQDMAAVSVDGMGDLVSTMVANCEDGKIEKIATVNYPHSLGFFYTAMTQFLGFPHYGDEYKVMGLAAKGEPRYLDEMRRIVLSEGEELFALNLDCFLHASKGVEMNWSEGSPVIGQMYHDSLSTLLGPAREPGSEIEQHHADLAASIQARYEEVLERILRFAKERTGHDAVTMSGGCAQNSLANGHVPSAAGFSHVFIPPSGHDGGTAIGAALWAAHRAGESLHRNPTPYLGQTVSSETAKAYLDEKGLSYREVESDSELFEVVGDCIKDGGVVGWVQGREEWGPRALGNRSILADPCRLDIKEILNSKIKRRESFRPFAPSITEEAAAEWFELDSTTQSIPYMEKVVPVKEEKRELIPAVTHYDNTARAQLVQKSLNPRYWGLLNHLGENYGTPMLVNTSFNENEPIVNSARDAIECFARTKMDMLVINNLIVIR